MMPGVTLPPLPWPPTSYPDAARIASAHAIEATDDAARLRVDLDIIVQAGDDAARTATLNLAAGRVSVDADAWHRMRSATIAAGLRHGIRPTTGATS